MENSQKSRSRNNKIIFITAGAILLLVFLSWQIGPDGRVVKISVGDPSYQVANMLSREGIAFAPLAEKEGVVVAYTPHSPWARLNKKWADSSYEIHFGANKVVHIVWRDRHGNELGRRLFVEIGVGPEG
ncbi:MAG: hypothetical protein PF568_07160 [Deltaproteobacteria bacterium]|jgi:hypothetical protein|nr:hypothetical protein [Deltaproteobacteria bacterium]